VRVLAVCSDQTIATRPEEEVSAMRKVVASEFISLDGVAGSPERWAAKEDLSGDIEDPRAAVGLEGQM
jgi:hypothetical protein